MTWAKKEIQAQEKGSLIELFVLIAANTPSNRNYTIASGSHGENQEQARKIQGCMVRGGHAGSNSVP